MRKARENTLTLPRYAAAAFLLALSVFALALAGCGGGPEARPHVKTPQKPLIWPAPPEPPRITYNQIIRTPGDIGAKKGLFTRLVEFVVGGTYEEVVKPYGMAVDSRGRLLAADTALKRVHVFDQQKRKYWFIDEADGETFLSPVGLAVDGDDNIYMTDSLLGRLYSFDPDGDLRYAMDAGTRPTGLAINEARGELYVTDTANHQINVYGLAGGNKKRSIGEWGDGPGQFNYPVDIFIDEGGDLYVVDTMNYRVQIFDGEGAFVTSFGRHGDGTGDFGRPKGVAVDGEGNIYVVDALFDTVQIFNRDGDFLLNFGEIGRQAGHFWMPSGLFIDEGDNIYVADSYNRRIQVFEYLGGGSS